MVVCGQSLCLDAEGGLVDEFVEGWRVGLFAGGFGCAQLFEGAHDEVFEGFLGGWGRLCVRCHSADHGAAHVEVEGVRVGEVAAGSGAAVAGNLDGFVE